MASAFSGIKIRALQDRADELLASTTALASAASKGLADPDLAVDIGRTLGMAIVINRLAELLASGAIPVSLLGLIERETTALIEECRPREATPMPSSRVPPTG